MSVSQLKCYLRCPRQYELKYVRGESPAFVPVALAFGSAVHAALASYYNELKVTGEPLGRDLMLDVFRQAWDQGCCGPVPLQPDQDDDLDMAHLTDRGTSMLQVFFERAGQAPAPTVESVESSFTVPLQDVSTGEVLEEELVGTIDLVVVEEDRRIVVEHKTAAKKFSADQLRFDIQPTAYALAARSMGLGDVGLRYQVITKTKNPAIQVEDVHRDEQDEIDFLRIVGGVLRAIDAGVSYPVRGWACRSCPYQTACADCS